ncbi:MAG: tetratricopeptide repeat protein, partial [Bacteroidia bacterium]|nr:tetratricopeptide repeat protein [Bacteroidia bacterium]
LSSFQTAIEQDPQMIDAYIDIGVLYAAKNHSLALQYYNNALKLNPTHNIALYNKAFFFQQKGIADSAITIYQKILSIYPNSPHVLYNLGAIEFALKKNNQQAIEYFTKAIQQKTDYAEAYYARAIVRKQQGKKQEAISDLQECLKYKTNFEPAIVELNELEKK